MEHEELRWLGPVFVALASTGVRISELAAMRWADVGLDWKNIQIANDPDTGAGATRARRRTKNRRDRVCPIFPNLRRALESLPRHPDGRVFHGPLGGVLNPDVVRDNLVKRVLPEVSKVLRERKVKTEIERGRLHSFRHYFCSTCANKNVPMPMIMYWLGHSDSKMVRYYYHLHDPEAQAQMEKLELVPQIAAWFPEEQPAKKGA
jgi:integrase